MTKKYFYLIIFLFLLDCSLNPNSKFWTKEKKILIDKSSAIILVKGPEKSLNEFNQNFKISIPKIISETGKVIFTPRIIDGAVPLLIQMTYVPILLLGGEFALSMWVFLTGWCLAFMLFVVARRYLSLNWSLCLVIILTTTPIVVGASGSGQVEIRLGLFVVGSS